MIRFLHFYTMIKNWSWGHDSEGFLIYFSTLITNLYKNTFVKNTLWIILFLNGFPENFPKHFLKIITFEKLEKLIYFKWSIFPLHMINCCRDDLKQNSQNVKIKRQGSSLKKEDIYKHENINLNWWCIYLSQQRISINKETVSYLKWFVIILQIISGNHKSKSWFQVLLEPVIALCQCNFHFIPCQEV